MLYRNGLYHSFRYKFIFEMVLHIHHFELIPMNHNRSNLIKALFYFFDAKMKLNNFDPYTKVIDNSSYKPILFLTYGPYRSCQNTFLACSDMKYVSTTNMKLWNLHLTQGKWSKLAYFASPINEKWYLLQIKSILSFY